MQYVENQPVEMDTLFLGVRKLCEELIASPGIEDFKTIKMIVAERAKELGIEIPPSYRNNLLREVSSSFKDMQFVHESQKCVLVYLCILEMDDDLVVK